MSDAGFLPSFQDTPPFPAYLPGWAGSCFPDQFLEPPLPSESQGWRWNGLQLPGTAGDWRETWRKDQQSLINPKSWLVVCVMTVSHFFILSGSKSLDCSLFSGFNLKPVTQDYENSLTALTALAPGSTVGQGMV